MKIVEMVLVFVGLESCMTFGMSMAVYAYKAHRPPMSCPVDPQVWLFLAIGPILPFLFYLVAEDALGEAWAAAHALALYATFAMVALLVAVPVAIWVARRMYLDALAEYNIKQKRKELNNEEA